jgi:branched-chain amino acid aminotransferase
MQLWRSIDLLCGKKNNNFKTAKFSTNAGALNIIDHTKLTIEHTKEPKTMSPLKNLLFGKEFSDHMLTVDWTAKEGWATPKIVPYGKISLDPSCSVFHYSMECFEGMKAYKDAQKQIRLFRPDKNMERITHSAKRIALPTFEPKGFLECLSAFLKLERKWIPEEYGYSLYLRPTLIGTQNSLGVGPSGKAMLFMIASPVGPYYPEGWKPVKLLADDRYVRAWPGGTGGSKVGGNYAPCILPQVEANQKGYTQVLWLFGPSKDVTEVGTMNFFLYWINKQGEKELITPPLDGTILPGVTRDSILSLAKQWKEFKVTEQRFTIDDIVDALKTGRVIEAFGAGTAAVVSPIKLLSYHNSDYPIPLDKDDHNSGIGKLTKRFADTILGIQYGKIPSDWSVLVK